MIPNEKIMVKALVEELSVHGIDVDTLDLRECMENCGLTLMIDPKAADGTFFAPDGGFWAETDNDD